MDGWTHGGCHDMNSTPPALTEPLIVIWVIWHVMWASVRSSCLGRELATVAESGIFDLKCLGQTNLTAWDLLLVTPLQLIPVELPHKIKSLSQCGGSLSPLSVIVTISSFTSSVNFSGSFAAESREVDREGECRCGGHWPPVAHGWGSTLPCLPLANLHLLWSLILC